MALSIYWLAMAHDPSVAMAFDAADDVVHSIRLPRCPSVGVLVRRPSDPPPSGSHIHTHLLDHDVSDSRVDSVNRQVHHYLMKLFFSLPHPCASVIEDSSYFTFCSHCDPYISQTPVGTLQSRTLKVSAPPFRYRISNSYVE